MTQFIVHVGPHKTGTSYLQECFARTRSQLGERGIHFPEIWGATAHHALYDALLTVPNPKLEAEFAALHAGKFETVLISVEGLTMLPEPAVAYFQSLVGEGNPLRCIFYARAWGEILPSQWKQMVKGGGTNTATLPEYLLKVLRNPANSPLVNFGVGLRIWAKYFGEDAISVVSYNQLVSRERDLFTHFAERFLGWPKAPKQELALANVSPGAADIELIRVIAALERLRIGESLSRGYAKALANRYMERRADLVTPAVAAALQEHTHSLFVDERIPTLAALHQDLMAEFGKALVPPRLPKFFFRPRRVDIPFIHSNWLLADRVLDDVKAIQQTLRGELGSKRHAADR